MTAVFYLLQADLTGVSILVAIALIIIIGYIARAIFNRTKIPEALILILIGLFFVPIGHLLPENYVNTLRSLASMFGDLALVVIMYNGGKAIGLNSRMLRDAKGLSMGVLDSLLPIIAFAIIMIAFGWPPIYGAMLGAVLGETSAVIAIPIIKKINIPKGIYNAVIMESTLNSVLAILAFTFLLSFTNGQPLSAGAFAGFAVDYISVSIAFGLVAGLLWLFVQSRIKGAREYLASLSMAILLFGVVNLFNGAAAISVLIFAIILGNYKPIAERLGFKIDINTKEKGETHAVERDIEFLIMTFFFVFIGMIALLSVQYLIYAILVTVLLVIIRYGEVVYVFGSNDKIYRNIVFALMQRGAVVAVLATILFSLGGDYFSQIFYICFMVIILTNVLGALLVSRTKLML